MMTRVDQTRKLNVTISGRRRRSCRTASSSLLMKLCARGSAGLLISLDDLADPHG
jgi:hypothetical protein